MKNKISWNSGFVKTCDELVIRQQLEKLYNKKKAYGAYTDKKKADIASMVRDEVQKDIEKIVDTDYKFQMLYMVKLITCFHDS